VVFLAGIVRASRVKASDALVDDLALHEIRRRLGTSPFGNRGVSLIMALATLAGSTKTASSILDLDPPNPTIPLEPTTPPPQTRELGYKSIDANLPSQPHNDSRRPRPKLEFAPSRRSVGDLRQALPAGRQRSRPAFEAGHSRRAPS